MILVATQSHLLYTAQMTRRIPDSEDDRDENSQFRDMLWMRRLRATPGRIALLRILDSEPKPLTSAEIAQKLEATSSPRALGGSLSRSSLFRVLDSLVETGLIHRINLGSPDSSYEIDFGRKHHHHVICTKCGDLEDVEVIKNCPARKVEHLALSKSEKFDSVTDHSLEFFGLCKKCA